MDLVDLCYFKNYLDCLNLLYKINLIQHNYRLYKHKQCYKNCLLQITEIGLSPPVKYLPLLKNGGFFFRESNKTFKEYMLFYE